MTRMRRTRIAAPGVALVAVTALVGCAFGTDGDESESVTLDLAHTFPETSAVHSGATALAERAPDVTDGRVNFTVYPGGQLGGDEEMGAGLSSGDLQCAFIAVAPSGLDDRLQLSFLPYIVTTYEAADEVFFNPEGVIQTNERDVLDELGITMLGFYENDFRGLTNSIRPIESPEDVQGLSFRVPGLPMYVDLFEEWGADPTPIPFPELYTALQQGTVDGQDNGIVLTYNSAFHEVQQYLTLTRHGYGTGNVSCNTDVWESLSEEDQEALSELIDEISLEVTQEVRDSVDERLEELEEDGLEIIELTEEQMAEFVAIRDIIWDAQEDTFGAELLEQLRQESDAAAEDA